MEHPDKTNPLKKDIDSTPITNPTTPPTKATKSEDSYLFTKHFEEATKLYTDYDNSYKRPLFAVNDTSDKGDASKIMAPLENSLKKWNKDQKEDYVQQVNNKLSQGFTLIQKEIEAALNKYNQHYKQMDGKDKTEALTSLRGYLLERVEKLLDKTKKDFDGKQEINKAIDNLKSLEMAAINELFTTEIESHARDAEKSAIQRSIKLINQLNPETVGVTVSNQNPNSDESLREQDTYKILEATERSPWKKMVNKIMDKSIYAKIDNNFIFLESRPQKYWKSDEGKLAIRRLLLLRIAKNGFKAPLILEAFNALKKPQPNKKVLAIMFEEAVKLGFDPKAIKSDGFTPEQAWLDKLNEAVKQDRVHSEYSNTNKDISVLDDLTKLRDLDNLEKDFKAEEMGNLSKDLKDLKESQEKSKAIEKEMSKVIVDDKDNTQINEEIKKINTIIESSLSDSKEREVMKTTVEDTIYTILADYTEDGKILTRGELQKELLQRLEGISADNPDFKNPIKIVSEKLTTSVSYPVTPDTTHIIQTLSDKSQVLEEYLNKVDSLIKKSDQSPDFYNIYRSYVDKIEKNYDELNNATNQLKGALNNPPENKEFGDLQTKLQIINTRIKDSRHKITEHLDNSQANPKNSNPSTLGKS